MTVQGEVRLLPISYIATSLRRTRGTVLYWERIKLLPSTPFVIYPDRHRAKRRLYPEDYVLELARIMDRSYPGGRLERESWRGFQEQVYEAYNDLVVPLLGGCYPPVEIELDSGQGPIDVSWPVPHVTAYM
jgi:hypothetical protein